MVVTLMTGSPVCGRLRSGEGEFAMAGTFESVPRSSDVGDGRAVGAVVGDRRRRSGRSTVGRAMGVVIGAATAVLIAAPSAAAEAAVEPSTGSSAGVSGSAAASDPGFFGLGAAGAFWLLAGLIALTVGIVLATRRERTPIIGQLPGPSASGTFSTRTSSDDEPGGARR